MRRQDRSALWYALIVWVSGFAWGSVVFSVPALDDAPGIPGVSSNVAISFPILVFWVPLTWWLARRWLGGSPDPQAGGVRLGLWFAGTNLLLDVLVLVLLFGSGLEYLASATVWLGYGLLFVIPAVVGQRQAEAGRRRPGRAPQAGGEAR